MSKTLQLKRGNTSVSNSYIGSPGELTVDTSTWDIRVHDGITAGGWILDSSNGGGAFSNITVASNATVGNLITVGVIESTGNITANYFIGNGSQLTGLPQSYSDNDTITLLNNFNGNVIPSANATYSLGNVTNQWRELWVSNNTIYIGGVPIRADGNTITVDGQTLVRSGNSDSIVTTGNINAGNVIGVTIYGNLVGNHISHPLNDGLGVRLNSTDQSTLMVAKQSFNRTFDESNFEGYSLSILNTPNRVRVTFAANNGLYFKKLLTRWSARYELIEFGDPVNFEFDYSNIRLSLEPDAYDIVTNVVKVSQFDELTWDIEIDQDPIAVLADAGAEPGEISQIALRYDYNNTVGFDIERNKYGMAVDHDDIDIRAGRDIDLDAGDDFRVVAGSTLNMSLERNDDQAPDDGININLRNNWNTALEDVKTWTFGFNGNLYLPQGGDIIDSQGNSVLTDINTGDVIFDENRIVLPSETNNGGAVQWNVDGTTQAEFFLPVNGNDGRNFVLFTEADVPFIVGVNGEENAKEWEFGVDGNLRLPVDGDILDSNGNSVFSGYATTSYVSSEIANLVSSAPGTLDTLNELAAALGDDPNFATTVSDTLGNINANVATLQGSISSLANVAISGSYTDLSNKPTIPSLGNFSLTDNNIQTDSGVGGITLSIFGVDEADPPSFITRDWTFANTGSFTSGGNLNAPGAVLTGNLTSGNIYTGRIITSGSLHVNSYASIAAQMTAYSLLVNTTSTFNGTITATNMNANGNITVGNILTDNYFYANGDPFVSSNYGDSDVTSLLDSFGSNNISTTGNVTANNFIGNIEITGNVTGTSANVDIIADTYQWSFDNTGNLTLPGNIFAVNYANGVVVSFGGNYSDANVDAYLPTYSGNITAGNILTDNYFYANGDPFVSGGGSGISDLIQDTSPQLGGNLDLNSNEINGSGNINILGDNITITNPGGGELYLYSSGSIQGGSNDSLVMTSDDSTAWIQINNGSTGTGEVVIASEDVTTGKLQLKAGQNSIRWSANALLDIPGNVTTTGNITTNNIFANGNITGSSSNVTITASAYTTTFDNTGNVTMPGNLSIDNSLIVGKSIVLNAGVRESFQPKANATSIVEHDCSTGSIFYHTNPSDNWTANLTNINLDSSKSTTIVMVIEQSSPAYYANVLLIEGASQTVKWLGNVTPSPQTNKTEIATFTIFNNSGTYNVLGSYSTYG